MTRQLGDHHRPAPFQGAILNGKLDANSPLYGNPYLPRNATHARALSREGRQKHKAKPTHTVEGRLLKELGP